MEKKENVREKIREANSEAVERILAAQPVWIDVARAGDVIPGMKKNLLLYAGPPQEYGNMCGPQRGAAWGCLIFEGLAKDAAEADRLLAAGEIEIEPANDHDSIAGAGQIVSFHQPVIVMKNETNGNVYYTHMKEDTFVALRYGAYGEHTIKKLRWLADVYAPLLGEGIRKIGGLNCRDIFARALFMGDEFHTRNMAQTCLFEQRIMPALLETDLSKEQILEVARNLELDENFFIYPSLITCKAIADSAKNVECSSIVTVMARNGTEFGIKVSGLGDRWFTAPSPMVDGCYFPGFSEENSCPDLGDSSITETAGFGGFVMAASPAVVRTGMATGIGGAVSDAINYTKEMYEITEAENSAYQIAYLDFRGCPTGINILKVLDTGIQPIITTSISPKDPGKSQAGAGLVRAPMECFKRAFRAFAEEYNLA